MKKMMYISVLIFVFILMLSPIVLARKGVGLVWDTETEIVSEKSKHCVQYGIYNPWEEDVTAILSVSNELKEVITKEESESKFIKAGTTHDIAVPIEFCFEIAEIYSEDCLVGSVICEQKCEEPEVVYEGKIVAMEEPTGEVEGGAGSATSLGVSVPLKLKVKCNPHAREWTLVYVVVIVIALILILWILYRKSKRKK